MSDDPHPAPGNPLRGDSRRASWRPSPTNSPTASWPSSRSSLQADLTRRALLLAAQAGLAHRRACRWPRPTRPRPRWARPSACAWTPQGQPAQTGLKFAEKWGVGFDQVRFEQPAGKKEPCAVVTLTRKGRPTVDLLAEALPRLIASLHVPKAMRWGSSEFQFVRPIRNVLCLFGGRGGALPAGRRHRRRAPPGATACTTWTSPRRWRCPARRPTRRPWKRPAWWSPAPSAGPGWSARCTTWPPRPAAGWWPTSTCWTPWPRSWRPPPSSPATSPNRS